MAGANGKDYFGKKLSPQEAEAVVAELKKYLLGLADRWLFKGRFHRDLEKGTLPMEAIQVFWQNWYGFVAEINNFHGVAYQRHLPFFKRHPELQKHFANHVADEMIHPKPPGHIRHRSGTGQKLRAHRRSDDRIRNASGVPRVSRVLPRCPL